MKQVFSLLLAFVFLQTQTWAIGGGPQGNGGGGALTGTYAGVLIPVSQTKKSLLVQQNSASIGLFWSVSRGSGWRPAPQWLSWMESLLGNMTGIADPQKETLVGIVEAQSNVDVITLVPVVDANGNVTYQQLVSKIFAQGSVEAR